MNVNRKTIEDFKKSASSQMMAEIRFRMVLPDNVQDLDYHARINAETLATDNAIAQQLGLTLTDHETWPEEFGQILATEWAAGLPDA
jgi:propanediol dehydratase small subunit